MSCQHEWEPEYRTELYNPNGEYVEDYGWGPVTITVNSSTRFRCEKCKSLKIVTGGQEFFCPPKPNPFKKG
jgi:hypothetical protein